MTAADIRLAQQSLTAMQANLAALRALAAGDGAYHGLLAALTTATNRLAAHVGAQRPAPSDHDAKVDATGGTKQ